MATSPDIDTLVARNTEYAQSHQGIPDLSEMQALNLPFPTTVIVTCADPRVLPERFLNLNPGEAIVFRIVGGRINQFVMHEILALDSFIGHGQLKNLMIVHHTDCGASHFTTDSIRKEISSRHPQEQAEIAEWKTGAFDGLSLTDSVLADIDLVKADKTVGEGMKANTAGFVYDLKTGLLSKVSS